MRRVRLPLALRGVGLPLALRRIGLASWRVALTRRRIALACRRILLRPANSGVALVRRVALAALLWRIALRVVVSGRIALLRRIALLIRVAVHTAGAAVSCICTKAVWAERVQSW